MAESPTMKLNNASHQRRLLSFLLIYRWISLAPAIWLFLSATGPVTPNPASILLLSITTLFTLLITLFHSFQRPVLGNPLFLGADLLFIAVLLTLSGAGSSLYSFYALSPLLAGALFFEQSGLLLAAGIFTLFYLAALALLRHTYTLDLGALFTQLAGLWLVPFLFEYPLSLFKQLLQAHQKLTTAHHDLTQHAANLNTTHHQLEVIHELTLFLQGASHKQSVQQRLLKAVTKDLGFGQAAVALVNPGLQRLESWQVQPPPTNDSAAYTPLPLAPENGPIVQATVERQVRWCSPDEPPIAGESMGVRLEEGNWLILPIVWQEQAVGVLLISVETPGPANTTDERWPILTALVSQAAVALGTLDRTRRLAAEKERNRIARDIHDTVAQSLFGIAFTLDACVKLLPNQAEMVKQELTELRHIADRVRQEVRQSILDIWPSDLTQEKFKADLCKYVTHAAPDHVFHIDFTIDGDFDGLPPVIRRSLYRISQEALSNTARHAKVDTARLYLGVDPDEIYLSIRDKGQGFDTKLALSRERDREHFGLRGMQERVQSLNGTCDILSQVGHGTQVLVRVPLNRRNGNG